MTTTGSSACLVLWDIDHTLIETRGVGGQLYRRAFEMVTGVAVTEKVEITGRTEHAIFAETLRRHGIEPTEKLQARYTSELAKQYDAHRQQLEEVGRMLPGADDALRALAREPGIVQTVLTGNLRAVAEIKLQVFKLEDHIDFAIGAYSDDHAERAELVAISQRRAGAKHDATFDRSNTVIIGDSVHDLMAAKNGGAGFVGVAGDAAAAQALRAAANDVMVLNGMTQTDDLLKMMRGLCQR